MKKLSQQQVIEKFIRKHGNKYDYSKVIYINAKTKVCVICPTHGEFYQTPDNHVNGQDCPICGNNKIGKKLRTSQNKIISVFNKIHNSFYNYDKVNHINFDTKICITCPIHGDFWQTTGNHINGIGCPKCAIEVRKDNLKLNTEEIIKRFISIHGNKFDYSLMQYINNRSKITIRCFRHGLFEQTPNNHLLGKGCPKCKTSKGETTIMRILEKHNIKYIHQYKLPNTKYLFRYDFYLPELNILIEFHGGQHYFPVERFGGIDNFNYIRERDTFKKELANLAKIPIIYFTYKHLRMPKDKFEKFVLMIINKF